SANSATRGMVCGSPFFQYLPGRNTTSTSLRSFVSLSSMTFLVTSDQRRVVMPPGRGPCGIIGAGRSRRIVARWPRHLAPPRDTSALSPRLPAHIAVARRLLNQGFNMSSFRDTDDSSFDVLLIQDCASLWITSVLRPDTGQRDIPTR